MRRRTCTLGLTLLTLWLVAVPVLAATRVVTAPNRQARPAATVDVWGAACTGGGCPLGDGSANGEAYVWSFTFNPAEVSITPLAPPLNGVVANDRFINEPVMLTLLGGATRAGVEATLTVGGQPSSNTLFLDVVDPTDPVSTAPLDNLAIDTNISIATGETVMYNRQLASGCWSSATFGAGAVGATTGFSLWALENSGHLPTGDPDQDVFVEVVQAGLACLAATTVPRGTFAANADVAREATAAMTTDVNGNARSTEISSGDFFGDGYSHPIGTAAFLASLDTATWTSLVEDAVDYIGFMQSTADGFGGFGRGGWDYNGPSTRSDFSINSWNWMALEGAETAFGVDAPDWILQESEHTLISHQTNPPDQPVGQPYGYSSDLPLLGHPNEGHATTCAGLSGLAAIQLESTVPVGSLIAAEPAPLDSIATRRTAALDWLGEKWTVDSLGGLGQGNRDNYYAQWTCCRALRLTEAAIGGPVTLVNGGVSFDWETGEENNSGNVPGAGAPREGYTPFIVRNQNAGGEWNEGTYLGTDLETPLALLCLNPTVFGPPSICGDNMVDGAEECDGTDDALCPGECIPPGLVGECTCPEIEEGACCANLPGPVSECIITTEDDCLASHHIWLADEDCDDPSGVPYDCTALEVTIDSMSAVAVGNTVEIHWTTASERDNAGFRVLRQDVGERAKRLQTVSGFIPAQGTGLGGATYAFTDDSRAAAVATVYFLEDVDVYGRVQRHGPIVVDREGRTRTAAGRGAAE